MAEVVLKWFGDRKKISMRAGVERALAKSSIVVESQAKLLSPVDTGVLRASIRRLINNPRLIAYVGTSTEYAPWVEFGTRRQQAQPYLRPALNKNKGVIKAIFKAETGDSLRG